MGAIAAAVVFAWVGMVLAISFLEAPLKFRAPGITLQVGLGIGRLVFRALNAVEIVLAAVVVLTVVGGAPGIAAAGGGRGRGDGTGSSVTVRPARLRRRAADRRDRPADLVSRRLAPRPAPARRQTRLSAPSAGRGGAQ
ncbi:MAG: hypothetical protein ABI253_05440 [Mycobacterium sp.]